MLANFAVLCRLKEAGQGESHRAAAKRANGGERDVGLTERAQKRDGGEGEV